MDVDTELSLIENLKNHFSEKILIIVSSRISTIFGFDNIIVLDNGSIIEEVDSKTLTKNNGLFSELLKVQKILPKEKVRN